MNRIVHFEIPCENPNLQMDFFKEVFDWKFQQFLSDEYWTCSSGDASTPGINGGFMKKKHPGQPIVNSIQVENLEQTASKIESMGGKIVVPKMAILTVGWLAYFTDPEGNIHGLYQEDGSAK